MLQQSRNNSYVLIEEDDDNYKNITTFISYGIFYSLIYWATVIFILYVYVINGEQSIDLIPFDIMTLLFNFRMYLLIYYVYFLLVCFIIKEACQ